jgi:hypothetical protein
LHKYKEYKSNNLELEIIVTVGLSNADKVKPFHKRGAYQAVFTAGTSDNEIIDFRRYR